MTNLCVSSPQCFWSTSWAVRLCAARCCWSGCASPGKRCCSAGWVPAANPPRCVSRDDLLVPHCVTLCETDASVLSVCPQLLSGNYKRTQTSITDSSAPYKAKNDRVSPALFFIPFFHETPGWQLSPVSVPHVQACTWTLIDLPGHDSLRPQYLEKFKSAARWEQDNQN